MKKMKYSKCKWWVKTTYAKTPSRTEKMIITLQFYE